ncbi:MAG: glutamine-hydrolyzing carbamoyl-phosphate synthase small subunit [Nitrospirae bacterium]|nr:glutamine-hydrolyzing carbamoyl-phosphate synthase small subunit [Nitrospirota bacterium]
MKKAILVLSDGLFFEGQSFGAEGETFGEVVFNTAMSGYQEILSDPSYRGQIVTLTYTQIGNYGINAIDVESSDGPKVNGFVVKESFTDRSNWRASKSLGQYLKEYGIVAIQGIDTRALTAHLRDFGSKMGIISTESADPVKLYLRLKESPGIEGVDLVKEVTTRKPYEWTEMVWGHDKNVVRPSPALKVVVYDFGVKYNILRHLYTEGFDVTVVPATTPAGAVIEMAPHGVLLSNGPGDPEAVTYAIENTKKLLGKLPIFGICLGHQILGLALGGNTFKLKFGHHGANHPVKDLQTGRIGITSQNHNYCVDVNGLRGQVGLTHVNLYDGTAEGMRHVELPAFSVQYHPEASPGPNDSTYLFGRFRDMISGSAISESAVSESKI